MYQDIQDFVDYVEDHLATIKRLNSPSLDGDSIDHIVASATYAQRRLGDIINRVLRDEVS